MQELAKSENRLILPQNRALHTVPINLTKYKQQ